MGRADQHAMAGWPPRGVSWAKAVVMKAETTLRPLLPARASTLRMKCARQRCYVADSAFSATRNGLFSP